VGAALGLAGLAVAQVMGARLLTISYGPEYAAHSRVFMLLMLATAIHFVASMLTSGIMSARCFRIQVPLFAMVAGATAWACSQWIPSAGLAGGAAAMVVGALVRLVLAAAIVGYLLLASSRAGRLQTAQASVDDWETGL